MPRIYTCGKPHQRKEFEYEGSVTQGVRIAFPSGTVEVTADFFQALLAHFNGQSVDGGFSVTNPIVGGVGEWIENNSQLLNIQKLSEKHGSHIVAILDHENYVGCGNHGNTITVQF